MREPRWVDSLSVEQLPKNDITAVTIEGREIAICTIGDAVYAIDNLCTHGNARLCDGFLQGHEVECPLHQGIFDVTNGQPLSEPVTVPLRTYQVKIAGTRVWVRFE
jgi:naphthalene 1,2-dioxygenase system ferredoxin subunit